MKRTPSSMPLARAAGGNVDPGSDRDNGDRKLKLESHGDRPWLNDERNIRHALESVKRRSFGVKASLAGHISARRAEGDACLWACNRRFDRKLILHERPQLDRGESGQWRLKWNAVSAAKSTAFARNMSGVRPAAKNARRESTFHAAGWEAFSTTPRRLVVPVG